MAESPYSETVIAGVIAALKGISEQSGDNYTIEDRNVLRYDRNATIDAARPVVCLRRVSETKSRLGNTEFHVVLLLQLTAKVSCDQRSGDSTDEQVNKLAFDIEQAIANIDYGTVDYELASMHSTTFMEDSTAAEEPQDGAIIDVSFEYRVDHEALQTSTGP